MASGTEFGDAYWVPDAEAAWLPCQLYARDGDEVVFVASNGRKLRRPASTLPTLQRAGRGELAGLDDICALDSVWEGAVLHTLRQRYEADKIYTRISQGILVAVNPFRVLPHVYSEEVQATYREASDSSGLPPHVYGIAQDALQRLRLPDAKDQAVLVSGESGAGKTESTKHILTFLLGRANGGPGSMEEKILSTNPVLEAFGNAATTRNRNSSRFGKWLDVRLSHSAGERQVHGCTLTHYLLETTRVCKHAPGESGYHIFYRLLQAPAELLSELGLLAQPEAYNYLQEASETPGGLEPVQEALDALGVGVEQQRAIFRTLAGILLLGNCEFSGSELTEAGAGAARQAAELLGLVPDELMDCMLVATRHIGREVTRTPRRPEEARSARDGLARLLYDCLFDWLMERMNRVLMPSSAAPVAGGHSFGFLDIAGFEDFGKNSLEQLLINLSNEYLQQSFNESIFKAEIQDCEAEGIPVTRGLGFCDNLDCLELLDGTAGAAREREPGILDLLDEAVAIPGTTDASFVAKVVTKFSGKGEHARFKAPRFGGCPAFTVRHFAGEITYSCDGWIEKNADRPPPRATELLAESGFGFVRCLGVVLRQKGMAASQGRSVGRGNRAQSASYPFRTSLRSLMSRMAASELHFVRCIKPREREEEGRFSACKVSEQLRSCGILEAVRIRQSGYGSRWSFTEFVARFGCVVGFPAQAVGREAAEELLLALQGALGPELGMQDLLVGRTKVFAKAPVASNLEARRRRALDEAVLLLQRMARVLLSRQSLEALRLQAERAAEAAQSSSTQPCKVQDCFVESCAAQQVPEETKAGSNPEEGAVARAPVQSAGGSCEPAEKGKGGRLAEGIRALEVAVQSRDEGLLAQVLSGVEVRLVEELIAQARSALAPLQRTRESRDTALREVGQGATDANVQMLEGAVGQGAAACLPDERLAEARDALRDAARQRAQEAMSSAVKSATQKTTVLSIQLLRRAIDQGAAAGLSEEQLAQARQTLGEVQRAAAQAAVQRAAEALDRAVRIASQSCTATNITVLQKALDQALAVNLPEDKIVAAQEALGEAQRQSAQKAFQRARGALADAVRCAHESWNGVQLDSQIEALQRAIDQGSAAGLPGDQLEEARDAISQARRMPALAALQRAHESLEVAVRKDAPSVNTSVEVLRGAIDRGAAAGLTDDELAAAREAVRGAPVAAALVALRSARERVEVALSNFSGEGVTVVQGQEESNLRKAIERSIAVGVGEEHLRPAQEAMKQLDQARALAVVQHACEALEGAVGADLDVSARVEALRRAVDRGVAADLPEERLSAAREAIAEAPRRAAFVAVQRAQDDLDTSARSGGSSLQAWSSALESALERAVASGCSEEQLAPAREALREAPRAAAQVALEVAWAAVNSAIRSADDDVDGRIGALWRAIDGGQSVGLPAARLNEAREAATEASRAAALLALQRAQSAVEASVGSNDDFIEVRLEALHGAVERGASVGVDPERLATAREAVRASMRAAAQSVLRRAQSALDAEVRGASEHVDASIQALEGAIQRAAAMGLTEEQLADAKRAARNAPQDAASAALQQAYGGLHSALTQSIGALQWAVARCEAVGAANPAAAATLQEATRLAATASLQQHRGALHSAPSHLSVAALQRAIEDAEAAGVREEELAAARADSSHAALEQARTVLSAALSSARQCPSDRNISLLQRAIDQAAEFEEGPSLTAARRVLEEAQQAAEENPVEECAICFEQEDTSLMPCCGRVGSGHRMCSQCLAQHTASSRDPRCPFCRAPL